jgi:RHS repeat-associated protein
MNGNVSMRGRQHLFYDANNRLCKVWGTNGVITTFGYSADGARLWEKSGTNTLQVWIGDAYEERDGKVLFHISAAGKRVCTFEPAAGGMTGYNPTNQQFYYYHSDYLGSSSVMTDRTGTNAVQHYEYSAFGQSRYTGNTNAFKVSKRYTGQILDEDTGLYYYNFRYYDPVLGRFVQPDDIIPNLADPQSYNRYSYCVNNPLRYTDPSGHGPMDYISGFFGFAQLRANTASDEWAKNVANKNGNMGFKSFADVQNYVREQKDPMGINADVALAQTRKEAVSVAADAAEGLGGAYVNTVTDIGGLGVKTAAVGTIGVIVKKTSVLREEGEVLSRLGTSTESASRLGRIELREPTKARKVPSKKRWRSFSITNPSPGRKAHLRQTEHPAACPPRTVFPVNSRTWFCGCVSPQHARFAFSQGCDRASHVGQDG